MSKGTDLAQQLFSQIIGMKITRSKLGYGSFITIDWGKDIIEELKTKDGIEKQIFCEWHLWVYMCTWRLEKNNDPIIGAGDERDVIESKIPLLIGKKLLQAEVLNNSFDVILNFDKGYRLLLFSFELEDSEQWLFFTSNRKVFTAGPGANWKYNDS
ncbi:MAG: hypothetical protein ACRCSV_00970 [Chlamydiales bacterium]